MGESVKYEGIIGVVVNRGPSISCLLVQAVGEVFTVGDLGIEINDYDDLHIPLNKTIESLEDLLPDQGQVFHSGILFNMHWTGFAYELKGYTGEAKSPIIIVSNPKLMNPALWQEITLTSAIEQINARSGASHAV